MSKIFTFIFHISKIRSQTIILPPGEAADSNGMFDEMEELYTPPQAAVNAILSYARSLEVAESKEIGTLEWVLN